MLVLIVEVYHATNKPFRKCIRVGKIRRLTFARRIIAFLSKSRYGIVPYRDRAKYRRQESGAFQTALFVVRTTAIHVA